MDKMTKDDLERVETEELEAAGQMFDDLKAGVFYAKQKRSGYTIKFIGEK